MPDDDPDAKATAAKSRPTSAKLWIKLVVRVSLLPVVLMLPAGDFRWWEAWVVSGLYIGVSIVAVVLLQRHDPALLAERMQTSPAQAGQKGWDKLLSALILVFGMGVYLVPGFDVVRFGWTERLPIGVEIAAMAAHIPCFVALGWVMRENTYLSRVVKIDTERDHHVITTGPYAIVRHPMYVIVIVMLAAFALALGSRLGLIPAALMAALLVIRTALEDRTLHAELPGYPEYATKTRYRLLPGIW